MPEKVKLKYIRFSEPVALNSRSAIRGGRAFDWQHAATAPKNLSAYVVEEPVLGRVVRLSDVNGATMVPWHLVVEFKVEYEDRTRRAKKPARSTSKGSSRK